MDYFDLKVVAQQNKKFTEVVGDIFQLVRQDYPCLGRISIAALENDVLSTYHSEEVCEQDHFIEFKEVTLKPETTLWQLVVSREFRVVDDLSCLNTTPQTTRLINAGFMSSLTVPILHRDKVRGVLFFNAKSSQYFSSGQTLNDFLYLAHILSSRYVQVIERMENFNRLLQVALKIGHHRDPETAQHLERMGKYSELLARLLARECTQITTEFIHRIRFYAPFHDIGKYRIPDEILFSNKVFSSHERGVMNKHPIFGEEIIEEVVKISELNNTPKEELQFVKNIVRFHHEAYDGSGYPDGLQYSNIPLEARIVTVADVFDALLSKRPYKQPWSISNVVQFLKEKTGTLFDPLCVKALTENVDEFLSIRALVSDEHADHSEYHSRLI